MLVHLNFSTKAKTLEKLCSPLKLAEIAPLVYFTLANWQHDRVNCLEKVKTGSGNEPWIVRSSCQIEDSAHESNAGVFLSVPDVTENDLENAIE